MFWRVLGCVLGVLWNFLESSGVCFRGAGTYPWFEWREAQPHADGRFVGVHHWVVMDVAMVTDSDWFIFVLIDTVERVDWLWNSQRGKESVSIIIIMSEHHHHHHHHTHHVWASSSSSSSSSSHIMSETCSEGQRSQLKRSSYSRVCRSTMEYAGLLWSMQVEQFKARTYWY